MEVLKKVCNLLRIHWIMSLRLQILSLNLEHFLLTKQIKLEFFGPL